MAFGNYGELKAALSAKLFHQRFIADYDKFTALFEASANARLRVRPMEAVAVLTTTNGTATIPADYLVWRTVLWTGTSPYVELDYVHPAYLQSTQVGSEGNPAIFTIEGASFKVRPTGNDLGSYEFHYYQKIPTLLGNDLNTNWLLAAYPNAYDFGLMTEAGAHGRNADMAQLYKARRDEVFQEIIQLSALTTGATSPSVRTAEYF